MTTARILTIQYAFLDQRLRLWPVLQLLFETVCAHMFGKLFLLALDAWCCGAVW